MPGGRATPDASGPGPTSRAPPGRLLAATPYRGPWNKPTAHPILVIGTTYDPATPFSGAQAMAEELAHARLLTHHGYGHTALTNPSTCVNTYESRYFITGTLPRPERPADRTSRPSPPPYPVAASPPAAEQWRTGAPEPALQNRRPPCGRDDPGWGGEATRK